MRQSEFGDALRYYENVGSLGAMDILRVIDRAMVMPLVNVFSYVSNDAALLGERLSPLFVLLAPLGYGLGYTREKPCATKSTPVSKWATRERSAASARPAGSGSAASRRKG